jgi:hypothetical protein
MTGPSRAIVRRTTIAIAIVVLTGTTATGGAGSNLALATTLHAVVESTTPLTLELTTSDGGRVRSGGVPVLAPGRTPSWWMTGRRLTTFTSAARA